MKPQQARFKTIVNEGAGIQNSQTAVLGQVVMIAVIAFIDVFSFVYFMQGVLDINFNDANTTATFIALAIMGFVGLILGTMTWLDMKSVPIFFLLMFFSMQMVTVSKQMLPESHPKYMVERNLLVYYADMLRSILCLNKGIELNSTMWVLIGFMIFGIASTMVAAIVRCHSTKHVETSA